MTIVNLKVTRNATILILGQTLVSVLNYAFWFVLARVVSLEVSGGVATILSIIAIFTFIMQPGIPMATSKYVSEHLSRQSPNSVRKTIKSAIVLVLALSLITIFFLITFAERITNVYKVVGFITPLRVSALLIAMISLQGVFNGVYQGFQKMEYCFLQLLFVAGSRFFLGLGFILLGFGLIGPVLGLIIGGFFTIFIASRFIPRLLLQAQDLRPHTSAIDPTRDLFKWTDLIRLAVPNSIIFGVISLSSQAGTLILGLFGGTMENIAWYYLSLQIILGITMISRAIGIALLPSVSQAWVTKNTNMFESTLNICLRYFYLITVPIVVIAFFFPEEILLLILGEAYLPAVPMLKILLLAIPATGTLQIFISVLTGIGATKRLIRLSLIVISSYFLLAVGLTAVYGLLGTSEAFTGSIAIGAFAAYWVTRKITKTHVDLVILAKILFPSTMVLILVILFTYLSLSFLLSLSLGIVIYMILSYIIGTFTREDITLLKNLIQMLTGNLNEKTASLITSD